MKYIQTLTDEQAAVVTRLFEHIGDLNAIILRGGLISKERIKAVARGIYGTAIEIQDVIGDRVTVEKPNGMSQAAPEAKED